MACQTVFNDVGVGDEGQHAFEFVLTSMCCQPVLSHVLHRHGIALVRETNVRMLMRAPRPVLRHRAIRAARRIGLRARCAIA